MRYLLDTYSGILVLEQHGPRLGGAGLTQSAKPLEKLGGPIGAEPVESSVELVEQSTALPSSSHEAVDQQSTVDSTAPKTVGSPPNGPSTRAGVHPVGVHPPSGGSDRSGEHLSGCRSDRSGERLSGCRWLSEEESQLVQRFDPRGDTIGFFIAKFRKVLDTVS